MKSRRQPWLKTHILNCWTEYKSAGIKNKLKRSFRNDASQSPSHHKRQRKWMIQNKQEKGESNEHCQQEVTEWESRVPARASFRVQLAQSDVLNRVWISHLFSLTHTNTQRHKIHTPAPLILFFCLSHINQIYSQNDHLFKADYLRESHLSNYNRTTLST